MKKKQLDKKTVGKVLLIVTLLLWTGTAVLAEEQYTLDDNQWYIRLIVSTDDGRRDAGNVLGHLLDSKPGKDSHDLAEMPPPPSPMGDQYLSIVFPHPEWGGDMPDYASDYRIVPADSTQGEVWNFEVHSHTPGIKAELSWEGSPAVLDRSRIKDAENGKVLVKNCAVLKRYTFILHKEGNAFIWEYLGQHKATIRDRPNSVRHSFCLTF